MTFCEFSRGHRIYRKRLSLFLFYDARRNMPVLNIMGAELTG